MLALVIEKVTNLSYQDAMKNCFQTIRNDKHLCIWLWKETNQLQHHLIEEISLWWWDYLDAIYGDKNIYSTPRDL
jgi:hypothetical protein